MGITAKCAYLSGMIRKHGIKGLLIKVHESRKEPVDRDYAKNWQKYMVTPEEWKVQRNTMFEHMPLISVVVPAYETPANFLEALMESMASQSYENWELCIADGSPSEAVACQVKKFQQHEPRIKYRHLTKNGGISENTNEGLEMAIGEYIGLLDHDDVLASNALYEVARMINAHPDCDVVYSDEDKIDVSGKVHSRPHLKLDYNKELLLHYNYICHFLVIKNTMLAHVGSLHTDFDGAQDYDLVLRLADETDRFYHIHKILYHWRVHEHSTAGSSLSKDYAYTAGKRALEAYVKRNHIKAKVAETKGHASYDIVYEKVTDAVTWIDCKDIHTSEELNARLLETKDNYIFLWDSSKVKSVREQVVQRLMNLCAQRRIGMVGVRFARRHKLVSAGIGMTPEGGYDYLYQNLPVCFKGYFGRATVPQDIEAVSMEACLIRREAYINTGSIDISQRVIPMALDYARRMRGAGYEVVLDAEVTLGYRG